MVKCFDLPNLSSAYQLTVVGAQIFFVGDNRQLWSTDGTTAGTRMLLEAPTVGSEAGAIDELTNANARLYFTTRDSVYGQELWRSDGTPEGTSWVTDLNPHGDAPPTDLTYDAANQKLYFTANNWLNGSKELFAVDTNETPAVQTLGANAIHEHPQVDLSLFAGRAVLSGSASRNPLVVSPLPDILTGNGGAEPCGLPALSDSRAVAFDMITGYRSDDHLDAPVSSADLTSVAGQASPLPGSATSDLLSAAVSAPKSAQAFTIAGESRVFIACHDGVAGFDAHTDGLERPSHYTISALQPVVIV